MPEHEPSLREALHSIRDLLKQCRQPLEVIEKHANAGNSQACELVQTLKALDSAFPDKSKQMAQHYRLLAETGDAKAQFTMGMLHLAGEGVVQDQAKAAEWFRNAATRGHAAAQSQLGFCYMEGHGVPQDFLAAANLLRAAAENGDDLAQFSLGAAHQEGRWVKRSDADAALWFLRAANQGNAPAQRLLAECYQSGTGVPKNLVEAHRWFNLAAARNVPGAAAGRTTVAQLMDRSQVLEAQSKATAFVPKKEQSPPLR